MKSLNMERPTVRWAAFAMVVFEFSAMLLLSFREDFDYTALFLSIALPAIMLLQLFILRRVFPTMDQLMLLMVHFLCGMGIILLYRLHPDRAIKQLLFYAAGIIAQIAAMLLTLYIRNWKKLIPWMMLGSWAFLFGTFLFGSETYGARNWIQIGGFSLQPSEFVKVVYPFVLAIYLSRSRRIKELIPLGVYAVGCILLLVLQKDLGAVLIYFATAIVAYYVATSDPFITSIGLAGATGGALLSYQLFSHVRVRVAAYKNPWAAVDSSGYQIIQGLMSIASGGLWGLGLTLGSPKIIPVYDSDYIFAVLCEEFGIIIGLCVLVIYALIFVRGALVAMKAQQSFDLILSLSILTTLAVQTLLIIGGVIKMIPLTGVTLPFLSRGGSSLISCLAMMGVLQGVAIRQNEQEHQRWSRARRRWEEQP